MALSPLLQPDYMPVDRRGGDTFAPTGVLPSWIVLKVFVPIGMVLGATDTE